MTPFRWKIAAGMLTVTFAGLAAVANDPNRLVNTGCSPQSQQVFYHPPSTTIPLVPMPNNVKVVQALEAPVVMPAPTFTAINETQVPAPSPTPLMIPTITPNVIANPIPPINPPVTANPIPHPVPVVNASLPTVSMPVIELAKPTEAQPAETLPPPVKVESSNFATPVLRIGAEEDIRTPIPNPIANTIPPSSQLVPSQSPPVQELVVPMSRTQSSEATPPAQSMDKKLKVYLVMGDDRPRFEVRDGEEVYLKVVCDGIDVKSPSERGEAMSTLKANGRVSFITPGGEGVCDQLSLLPGTGLVQVTGRVTVRYQWGKAETTMSGERMEFRLGEVGAVKSLTSSVSNRARDK